MSRKIAAGLLLATAMLALPAAAHHSLAMFDASQSRTLRGHIVEFRWSNPHVAIFVQEEGTEGRSGVWSIELSSPGNLRRLGWSRTTLKSGDHVEVNLNPMRDGRKAGGFRDVTFLDTGVKMAASLVDIERNLRGE